MIRGRRTRMNLPAVHSRQSESLCPPTDVNMKRIFAVVFLVAPVLYAADAPPLQKLVGGTPMQWSVRMADSEMARRGDSLAWKEGGTAKWDYTTGLFTLSLL